MSGLHFGLTLSLSRRVKGRPFDPSSLFANSEQGTFFDPSDLTTLFQDAAGGTPVTADGDPVGLMLDKHSWGGKTLEQVLAGQPELVVNGDFSNGSTGWNTGTGWVAIDGKIVGTPGSTALSQNVSVVSGRMYRISFDIEAGVYLDCKLNGERFGIYTKPQTVRRFIFATGETLSLAAGGSTDVVIDNISIKEIPGNHASQSTLAARPTYKTDGTLSWTHPDGVDDALTVTLPDLGTDATVAYVNTSGVTILEDQTISGSYTLPDADLYALVIVDRPLTTAETNNLTAWMNGRAGL